MTSLNIVVYSSNTLIHCVQNKLVGMDSYRCTCAGVKGSGHKYFQTWR